MQPAHHLRLVLAAAVAAFALMAAPAAAQTPQPPSWLDVEDGVTQPQFDFAQAIEQTVFVESTVDTDDDGRLDRIRIRISRPAETESQDYKVPIVFEHSPYRGDLGGLPNHPVDFDRMPQETGGEAKASVARKKARAARARAARRPTSPARSTTTTCRAATPSCWARASGRSTPTAAPTSAPAPRRSAPRRSSTG